MCIRSGKVSRTRSFPRTARGQTAPVTQPWAPGPFTSPVHRALSTRVPAQPHPRDHVLSLKHRSYTGFAAGSASAFRTLTVAGQLHSLAQRTAAPPLAHAVDARGRPLTTPPCPASLTAYYHHGLLIPFQTCQHTFTPMPSAAGMGLGRSGHQQKWGGHRLPAR